MNEKNTQKDLTIKHLLVLIQSTSDVKRIKKLTECIEALNDIN